MNVLIVTDGLPFGPTEAFLLPELEYVTERDHAVTLMPIRHSEGVVHAAASRYVSTAVVADPRFRPLRREVVGSARWLRGLRRFRDSAPRSALLRGALVAEVTVSRQIDHIHAAWASGPAAAGAIASALTGVSWSFSAHRYDILERPSPADLLATASFGRFISHDGLAAAQDLWPHLPARVEVIHLGVKIPRPAPWPRQPNILYAAQMVSRKDHATLIEAFSRIKSARHLLLAGDGPLRSELENLAQRSPSSDRILFLGQLAQNELLDLLDSGQVSAVVQTSRSEGISVFLMEALARSIPAAATDVGGTQELLRVSPDALFKVGDQDGLVQRLQRLLDDADMARAQGERGRSTIIERFDAQDTSHQLLSLMNSAG